MNFTLCIIQTDVHFELWTIVEEDIRKENPEIEHVAQFFERLESYTFEYDEEAQFTSVEI